MRSSAGLPTVVRGGKDQNPEGNRLQPQPLPSFASLTARVPTASHYGFARSTNPEGRRASTHKEFPRPTANIDPPTKNCRAADSPSRSLPIPEPDRSPSPVTEASPRGLPTSVASRSGTHAWARPAFQPIDLRSVAPKPVEYHRVGIGGEENLSRADGLLRKSPTCLSEVSPEAAR